MGIDTLKQEDKGDKGSDMINYNEIGDNELEHFCDTLSSAKRFQYTLGSNFFILFKCGNHCRIRSTMQ